jgi:23S rRNA pseudouridine1911/1915/1917 synthase
MVVNKPPGMVVHPGFGNYSGTLVNAMLWHLEHLPKRHPEDIRPGLVHRIDKNTSGLLLLAKNELTQSKLARQFFDHSIERTYQAIVWGEPEHEKGTIVGNIGRSLRDRKIMTVFPEGDMGKEAITHYSIIEKLGYVTLIECRLETGRTHQIRAHMRYLGHPLFNDETYGGDQILKGTTFTKYKQFITNCFSILPRQALHAKSLGFVHPSTGKMMLFDSQLPEDMNALIEKWRQYTRFNKNEQE